jgi:hypothetical protein
MSTISAPPEGRPSETSTTNPDAEPGGRRRRRWKIILVVALLVLTPVGISLEHALTYPGSASWRLRLVEWTRDHGGAPVVDRVENWWYTRHRPGDGHPAPGTTLAPPQIATRAGIAPPALAPLIAPALAGEGRWQPLGGRHAASGSPLLWATYLRPDPQNSAASVGIVSMDPRVLRAELIAGTRDPGGRWPEGAEVPVAQRRSLAAAFNAGFKFSDTRGGFAADGRVTRPLVDGLATAVIRADGTLTVERWNGGPRLTSDVRAVRQNLDLVVEHGRPAAGLATDRSGRWGSARNQRQYTWRSGLGETSDGRVVYVAGSDITLSTLADALVRAGAVTGMQLDIHPDLVTFNAYTPVPGGGPSALTGIKLLPAMRRPATRYLSPDQRDFFALLAR